jgi:RNA-directed DNA polymerase
VDRYYGQFHPTRRNRWVFGGRDSGAYLPKFAWTRIVRHAMVVGAASPDDPALADYWAQRRRKQPPPPLSAPVRHLLGVQQGRCRLRRASAPRRPTPAKPAPMGTVGARHPGGDPQQHIAATTNGESDGLRLIHSFCRRRTRTGTAEGPVILHA